MIISSDFKTESLVYREDIHRESLLTCVISMAVSFNTQQGFQTESLVYRGGIHGKSLLTVVISVAVSFNTWWGFQSVESMIISSGFQN